MNDIVTETITSLKANGFDVLTAENQLDAIQLFWNQVFYKTNPKGISWGGS